MKVAIIEDEQSISEMYEFKLKQSGYNVKVASDGEAGYLLIEDFKPDIVLLDLKMPKMTGDELLKKLRATDWGKKIKVVILTNISSDDKPEALNNLEISDYIVKAYHTPHQVADKIKIILEQKD